MDTHLYIVFAWNNYEACGGMNDAILTTTDRREAEEVYAKTVGPDTRQLVNGVVVGQRAFDWAELVMVTATGYEVLAESE